MNLSSTFELRLLRDLKFCELRWDGRVSIAYPTDTKTQIAGQSGLCNTVKDQFIEKQIKDHALEATRPA